MTDQEQREAARQFSNKWKGRGQEKQDDQSFWFDLLSGVFGINDVTDRIEFQKDVISEDGTTKWIDGYITETRVLIEQKSLGVDLGRPQPGHNNKTPYEQAKEYDNALPVSEKALWIVLSNFGEFWIYDMDRANPKAEPVKITLSELPTKYHIFDFLTKKEVKKVSDEMQVSLKAGDIVGKLYSAFLKQYKNPDNPETLKSLNKLCVRIVFCLYAEDAGVFGRKSMFHDYMAQFDTKTARKGLANLFRVLDQKPEERDPYLSDDDPKLAEFPYVNGGLFADEDIEIPPFTDEIMSLILRHASEDFDWSGISPTIFGAVFESTLNPETRRSGGMHYTSIENIHKVIDPLFLDDLKAELEEIKADSVLKTRNKKLDDYWDKLASLNFLDPACGSGNFLTESYMCLRRLENEVIELKQGGQQQLADVNTNPIRVSIGQFYGIEINDFAVSVAKTALWIAESQMMRQTEDIIHFGIDFFPLKANANIVEGNALRIDWESVVPKEKLSYIMGNPPFVGYSLQTDEQKEDILSIYVDENGKTYTNAGKIDYVSGWYFKSAEMMFGTEIKTALVSTNSITQGEQVSSIWKPLYDRFGIHIDFAYRTFIWDSEANIKAHVHCVIIGFSSFESNKQKLLFSNDQIQYAYNINPYLVIAENIFIDNKNKPICDVPILLNGGKPTEGGFLILSEDEKNDLICKEPQANVFIRPYMMGKDFIQRKSRYCLWLVNADPARLRKCPLVLERIENVRVFRLNSKKEATQRKAETPQLFDEVRECTTDYVAIPKVSSERRRYIPMEYLKANVIPGDKLFMIEGSSLYHLGVLTSNVHMAWTRAVCGRLKSDYSYSNTIVYNNFPWPSPTPEQRSKIEKTAQGILDARALYPDSSLADLYDPNTMPKELLEAHQANDRAVMQAYGMPIKETDEAACVAWLMRMYQELTGEKK